MIGWSLVLETRAGFTIALQILKKDELRRKFALHFGEKGAMRILGCTIPGAPDIKFEGGAYCES